MDTSLKRTANREAAWCFLSLLTRLAGKSSLRWAKRAASNAVYYRES